MLLLPVCILSHILASSPVCEPPRSSAKLHIREVPSLLPLPGKSFDWAVKRFGEPYGGVAWKEARMREDLGGGVMRYTSALLMVRDEAFPGGVRMLQVQFSGVDRAKPSIEEVEWSLLSSESESLADAERISGVRIRDCKQIGAPESHINMTVTKYIHTKYKSVFVLLKKGPKLFSIAVSRNTSAK
jgi:hypothetical protein